MHCPELGSCSVKHRNAYPKAPIFLPKTPHSCARVRRFFLIPPRFCFGCARETAVSSAKTDEIGGRRRCLPPISEYHFSAGNHRTGLSSSPFEVLPACKRLHKMNRAEPREARPAAANSPPPSRALGRTSSAGRRFVLKRSERSAVELER